MALVAASALVAAAARVDIESKQPFFFFVGRAACRAEARTDFHCSALHFFFSLPSLGLLSLPFLRCANSPLSNTAFARHESRIVRLFPLPRALASA